jgi:RNA-binding protein 5/10
MPALYPHSGPKRVKIDFAGTRGEAGSAPAAATAFPPAVRGHDGTRDIGQPDGTQRVLLLRGLDAGTYAGEISHRMVEEVARMLGKSVREAEGAITRVATIVDRTTEGLWSFAFVELVTPELAAALLPFLLSPQHQPNGFLIAQVPIAASFANPAAFLPTAPGPLGTQYLVRAAPNGGIGSAALDQPEGEWCGYWHQAAGAVETVPRGAPPVPLRGAQAELPEGLKVALGRYAGAGASAQPPVHRATGGFAPIAFGAPSGSSEATPGLVPNAMQPIKIGLSFGAGAAGRKKPPAIPEDGIIPISHKNILGDDDDEKDPGRDSVLLSRSEF